MARNYTNIDLRTNLFLNMTFLAVVPFLCIFHLYLCVDVLSLAMYGLNEYYINIELYHRMVLVG
jgi:hypothetical protein